MSRHRAEPPRRQAEPPAGRRRAEPVKPRYGRLAILGASVSVTGVALLGAVGVLPSVASDGDQGDDTVKDTGSAAGPLLAGAVTTTQPSTEPAPQPSATAPTDQPQDDLADNDESKATPPVPDDSGDGKRIVFDQSDQRV